MERLLLETTHTKDPHPLEVWLHVAEPAYHFYCHGLSLVDFVRVFASDLKSWTILIYRMPQDLLNPNYWEPYTPASESQMRDRIGGIIVKQEKGKAHLWRGDGAARGRFLREDAGLDVTLIRGPVFVARPSDLDRLASTWMGGGDRLEWIAATSSMEDPALPDIAARLRRDLSSFRLTQPECRMLYSSQDDHFTKVVFSSHELLRKALDRTLRGFSMTLSRRHAAPMNQRLLDTLIRIADGIGLTADPQTDFINKDRTFEIVANLGRTAWGVLSRPDGEPDERILLYYDRVSGIWALSR